MASTTPTEPNNEVYDYVYLKDVIAQEMSPSSFLQPALDAQAIAARTYAYWHINATGSLNNSNQHHVFLPYRYQQFADTERGKVDSAVANRYYMSYHRDFFNGFRTVSADEPIFSEFSSDAYQQSLTHVEQNPRHPYLLGVEDPISFHPDIPPLIVATNAHQRGLSQNGAGRWARASSSFRCDPAPRPVNRCPAYPILHGRCGGTMPSKS
ncbi:MAG: SpoIID/LytB domain-containing protein [Caldilineaceae bacterium]